MTAINSNRAIRGPVTAVPVVAGKGVRLVADTENNRWVVEADETVLFEDSDGTNGNTNITLSESVENFEYVQINYTVWDDEKYTQKLPVQSSQYQLSTCWFDGVGSFYHFCDVITISGTTYSLIKAGFHSFNSTSVNIDGDAKKYFKTYKVIGVNRIASN